MKKTVQKWGNSLAIRIPKSFAAETHLEYGSRIELSVVDKHLVIKPLPPDKKYHLDNLLADITDVNVHREVDFGGTEGRELL